MSEEIFDIYDEDMKPVGTAQRGEAHRMGYWHRTIQVWFLYKDEKEYILLQKRSDTKDTYPGYFDITAAGHLSAGEQLEEGVREIEEELGITVAFDELVPLGVHKQRKERAGLKDYEFAHGFLYESSLPLEAYSLQVEEVSSLVKIEIEAFEKLVKGIVGSVRVEGFSVDKFGEKQPAAYDVILENLVPHGEEYYIELCDAAALHNKKKRE